jgi:hypothetical protein
VLVLGALGLRDRKETDFLFPQLDPVSLSLPDWQLGHWLSETKDPRLRQSKGSRSENLRRGKKTSLRYS